MLEDKMVLGHLTIENLIWPNQKIAQEALEILRTLTISEVAEVYRECEVGGLFDIFHRIAMCPPLTQCHSNRIRRENRLKEYTSHLSAVISLVDLKLQKRDSIIDLGCGDGRITTKLFAGYNGKLIGCDLVNYLAEDAKGKMKFVHESVFDFLRSTPSESYNLVMENCMLHHLPTKEAYRWAVSEMLRVVTRNGIVIITETIHPSDWYEDHLRQLISNAIYDVFLNWLTSVEIHSGDIMPPLKNFKSENIPAEKKWAKMIPTPLSFLSEVELEELVISKVGKIVHKSEMRMTEDDPKHHVTYVIVH